MALKHGLGRGLDALIKNGTAPAPEKPAAEKPGVRELPIELVSKAAWQPRKEFDPDALAELALSIREHGVLQPLLVRTKGDGYELLAGERRLRAAHQAGLAKVPVIVMDAGDEAALEVALIENLQREDLNVMEEAEGYRALADKFDLTQEQIAGRVGKARASVANTMRLLQLPDEVKELVASKQLSAGHAKVLAQLPKTTEQIFMARRTVDDGLSVRNLEKAIEKARRAPRKPRAVRYDMPAEHVTYLTEKLHERFGTSVRVRPSRTFANGKKARGSLEIDFYSNEELDGLLEILGLVEE